MNEEQSKKIIRNYPDYLSFMISKEEKIYMICKELVQCVVREQEFD